MRDRMDSQYALLVVRLAHLSHRADATKLIGDLAASLTHDTTSQAEAARTSAHNAIRALAKDLDKEWPCSWETWDAALKATETWRDLSRVTRP